MLPLRLSAAVGGASGLGADLEGQPGETNVQTVLVGVAVTLFTVAIMWAGFKMAFQQA